MTVVLYILLGLMVLDLGALIALLVLRARLDREERAREPQRAELARRAAELRAQWDEAAKGLEAAVARLRETAEPDDPYWTAPAVDPCPHGPDEPCTCDGCWSCTGHVVGCTCDVDWDAIMEQKLDEAAQ